MLIYMYTHVCVFIYTHVGTFVCMYVFTLIYMYTYMYFYVCVYVYIYISIYMHTLYIHLHVLACTSTWHQFVMPCELLLIVYLLFRPFYDQY